MVVEINTDSVVWLQVKHALREAGYKSFLQPILFDNARANLFLEPRCEPEGGELRHGFLIYDGGSPVSSQVYEVYDKEVQR